MAQRDEDALDVIADFLGQYISDQRRGEIRSLAEYQALHPGYEEVIALEFRNLQQITSIDGASPTTWRSIDEIPFSSITDQSDLVTVTELPHTLGPYRLEEELGRGGQGAVYRGTDTRSGEPVALKILHAGAAGSVQALMRFEREAALTARLADPAISTVRETGVLEGIPFIAMDFVAGGSLDAILRQLRNAGAEAQGEGLVLGPPPMQGASHEERAWARIVGILRFHEKLARALHAAHELGIIHRDVKPGNIIDGPDHQPVLLDFGLARQLEDGGLNLTISGDLFGTPAYMSPEQVTRQGITLDRRTDVYSLGATLYECLTLHRPFEEATRDRLFQAIIAKPAPDPRRHDPAITSKLKMVLDTALAKDRDHRYHTALDFAEDLRRLADSEPIRAKPPSPGARIRSWTKRNPVVAASLAAVLLTLSVALIVTLGALRSERNAVRQISFQAAAGTLEHLKRRDDELWPALPHNVAGMEEWLARARPLQGQVATYCSELWAGSDSSLSTLPDPDLARSILNHLTENAEDLGTRITRMEKRLHQARTVRSRTIDTLTDAWQRAAQELSLDPDFLGFELQPICGLIPLGCNPESELQEFAVAGSGATIPEMDPRRGRYALRPGDAIVLVLVPGGSCELGSSKKDPRCRLNEVLATRDLEPFFLGKFEVSQHQFVRIMGHNTAEIRDGRPAMSGPPIDARHPIETVTWHEARTFARRLDLELPTEARWEAACRAGTRNATPRDEGVGHLRGYENLADQSTKEALRGGLNPDIFVDWDDGFPYSAPVGSFRPNPWGFHDMLGNVQEWCADPYHDFLDRVVPTGPDGCSPERVGDILNLRVYRGTGWQSPGFEARAAWRYGRSTDRRAGTIGMRVARRSRP